MAELHSLQTDEGWEGATSIFAANLHVPSCREWCTSGLLAALTSPSRERVLKKMEFLFQRAGHPPLDITLVRTYLDAVAATATQGGRMILGLTEWLASVATEDPDLALEATEVVLQSAVMTNSIDGKPYTRLLTALFREAEERELSDSGTFLSRVVAVQDALLKHGMPSLEAWLEDAERQ